MQPLPDTVHIDSGLVERLVAAQFPEWAHLPVAPVEPGGWDNRTFRLGAEMIVRLPSASHYAGAVDREQRWLPKLAPHLPLPIPQPLAKGRPMAEFPWNWSVYNWLEGETATAERVGNMDRFAAELAGFLRALQTLDTAAGPTRKLRGGSLSIWDEQARTAIDALAGSIDTDAARRVWDAALDAPFGNAPVWFHGDVAAGNLLVREGALCAVIDFGGLGVGDPACDMAIAWTFLSASSRQVFRQALAVDDAVWARGCGWALWKGLIVLAGLIETNAVEARSAPRAVDEILRGD